VPFVDLVFSSDEHLNHLLGYIQGVCFRPLFLERRSNEATTNEKNDERRELKAHPLKDSKFEEDISSERSKQMICREEETSGYNKPRGANEVG